MIKSDIRTISLFEIIRIALQRKVYILSFSLICASLAFFYTLTVSPPESEYVAKASFSSVEQFKLDIQKNTKIKLSSSEIFKSFLVNIASKKSQIEIFNNGDYSNRFNLNANNINQINSILSSIRIFEPELKSKKEEIGMKYIIKYAIQMNGTNEEFLVTYLNDLINTLNVDTKNTFKDRYYLDLSNKLIQIEREQSALIAKQNLTLKNKIHLKKIQIEQEINEIEFIWK